MVKVSLLTGLGTHAFGHFQTMATVSYTVIQLAGLSGLLLAPVRCLAPATFACPAARERETQTAMRGIVVRVRRAAQKRSTQGRTSISHDQTLRGCARSCT